MTAFAPRRPTRDLDLHAQRLESDVDTVRDLIADIAALDLDDGLEFDTSGATAQVIREDDQYSGVRVTLAVGLHTAKLSVKVDVNVGDPIWPASEHVTLPRLLTDEPLILRGYPLRMVLAEKLVTAIDRGVANTRWRDFADIYLLSGYHPVDGADLAEATLRVADHRGVELTPLVEVLDGLPGLAQSRWVAWRAKQDLTDRLPGAFADVVSAVIAFGDPIATGAAAGASWKPGSVLVVDEAGMVGTRQLARLLHHAGAQQVKVALVGDPHQLPETVTPNTATSGPAPPAAFAPSRQLHQTAWPQARSSLGMLALAGLCPGLPGRPQAPKPA